MLFEALCYSPNSSCEEYPWLHALYKTNDEERYFQEGELTVAGYPCIGEIGQIAVRPNWVTLVSSSSRYISLFLN